ncbi:hypothetical protein CLOM_g4061 [Closterium sp. NIES-68]|nr:hypothetical protein CLOM_g19798 [Closterium sp. NIES-68]GJP44702.1 hypothetical protein CLOM_g4061 [Closterium sp. NIES-68]GJP73758.1 hypothetical protein CLOP_g4444 [Closterium sp. NIES-67]GJP80573.1 hypothetical protein CLOP_g10777 [Closterium sp. NIES-67]GJP80575.1 hypothetical protein CLOP_g10779 [Closterium sp. NIES-67]
MAPTVSSRGALVLGLLFASALLTLAARPKCVLYSNWDLSDKQQTQAKKGGKSTKSLPTGRLIFKEYKGDSDESFDLSVTADLSNFPEPPLGIVVGKGKFGSNTGVSWWINKPWSGGGGSYKLDFKLSAIEKMTPRGGSGSILEVLQAVDKGVVSDYYTAVLTKSSKKSGGLVGGGFVKGFPNILPMFSC